MAAAAASIDGIDVIPIDPGEAGSDPRTGDVLVVRGWAYSGGGAGLAVVVDGTTEYPIGTRFPRPDVAAALNDVGALDCGFTVCVPTLDLDDGEHALAVVAGAAGRAELARARFRLAPAGPLRAVELARACADGWVDEAGTNTRIDDRVVRVPAHAVIRIDGWATDTVSDEPAVAAFALVGDRVVEVAYGFERMDIAREFGGAHGYCGFSLSFPTTYLSARGTPFRLVLLAADGVTLRHTDIDITLAVAEA